MTEGAFSGCVRFLQWLSELCGTSYEAVNVWIFCFLWPLLTLGLLVTVVLQNRIIKRLSRQTTQA